MTLGLFLILIVVLPYCIYLYIQNKNLIKRITDLEIENKEILNRSITTNKTEDSLPLTYISNRTDQNKKKEINNEKETFKIDNLSKNFKQDFTNLNTKEEYLKEVMNKMNQSIKEPPIELTNFEKEQENNAIISYQELKQDNKSKSFIVDAKDTPEDFLRNLKQFRSNLNK